MFTRTHFFLVSLAITAAYGFYIITSDDAEGLRYPSSGELFGDVGVPMVPTGFVPEVAAPKGVMIFDDDDDDYMDRVERLQHALRSKRSVIALADAYSQNIRPVDLDGMRLVRQPVIEFDDEGLDGDEYDDVIIPSRLTKRSYPLESDEEPISFLVL